MKKFIAALVIVAFATVVTAPVFADEPAAPPAAEKKDAKKAKKSKKSDKKEEPKP
jgi:ribosomal protein L12E/L44/L45/RPP1/RPP2